MRDHQQPTGQVATRHPDLKVLELEKVGSFDALELSVVPDHTRLSHATKQRMHFCLFLHVQIVAEKR
jgi:hypothetical protein